jgi:hypothetical protein
VATKDSLSTVRFHLEFNGVEDPSYFGRHDRENTQSAFSVTDRPRGCGLQAAKICHSTVLYCSQEHYTAAIKLLLPL